MCIPQSFLQRPDHESELDLAGKDCTLNYCNHLCITNCMCLQCSSAEQHCQVRVTEAHIQQSANDYYDSRKYSEK